VPDRRSWPLSASHAVGAFWPCSQVRCSGRPRQCGCGYSGQELRLYFFFGDSGDGITCTAAGPERAQNTCSASRPVLKMKAAPSLLYDPPSIMKLARYLGVGGRRLPRELAEGLPHDFIATFGGDARRARGGRLGQDGRVGHGRSEGFFGKTVQRERRAAEAFREAGRRFFDSASASHSARPRFDNSIFARRLFGRLADRSREAVDRPGHCRAPPACRTKDGTTTSPPAWHVAALFRLGPPPCRAWTWRGGHSMVRSWFLPVAVDSLAVRGGATSRSYVRGPLPWIFPSSQDRDPQSAGGYRFASHSKAPGYILSFCAEASSHSRVARCMARPNKYCFSKQKQILKFKKHEEKNMNKKKS
jgi:hypothetical protein